MNYYRFSFIILIFFFSCKRIENGNQEKESAIKSEVITNDTANELKAQNKHLELFNLPFGAKELIGYEFPKDTSIVFGYKMKERPEIEKILENIHNYYKIFNLWNSQDSIKVSHNNKTNSYNPNIKSYNYYDIPLVTKKKSNKSDNVPFYCRPYNSFVKLGRLKDFDTFELSIYTTFPKYYGDNVKIQCIGDNPIVISDLVIKSKKGELVDKLNIYYSTNEPYNTHQVYPYIDKNYIITLVAINSGENYEYVRKEKWKIKPNGKVVRYYETDGTHKSKEELGEVKNSMREGKWIEMKNNGIVDEITYLESEFKEGEPINEWKYYSFKNFKKGNLLYVENYKDGKLQERIFAN